MEENGIRGEYSQNSHEIYAKHYSKELSQEWRTLPTSTPIM